MTAKRGEIRYADLNPIRGSEQAGVRPFLVVQNDSINPFTTRQLLQQPTRTDGFRLNGGD